MPPKSKSAKPKGQKSIMTFFGQPKKAGESSKARKDEQSDDMEVDDVPEDGDDEQEDEAEADGESGVVKSSSIENSDLPPIHEIPSIFADLVSRIPDIKGVAQHLKGRKMRVATMCSGTESPLLALNLICRNISEQYGIDLEYEHVFSCEIEPFKQAYIERNFQPPLLFRDVCELGDGEA